MLFYRLAASFVFVFVFVFSFVFVFVILFVFVFEYIEAGGAKLISLQIARPLFVH